MNTTTAPRPSQLVHVDDRCDRCSAAARVLVLLRSGGELVFCRHHANEFRDGLRSVAVIIESPGFAK
jgi:hypothetical protein